MWFCKPFAASLWHFRKIRDHIFRFKKTWKFCHFSSSLCQFEQIWLCVSHSCWNSSHFLTVLPCCSKAWINLLKLIQEIRISLNHLIAIFSPTVSEGKKKKGAKGFHFPLRMGILETFNWHLNMPSVPLSYSKRKLCFVAKSLCLSFICNVVKRADWKSYSDYFCIFLCIFLARKEIADWFKRYCTWGFASKAFSQWYPPHLWDKWELAVRKLVLYWWSLQYSFC